jgi:hypothetical protein
MKKIMVQGVLILICILLYTNADAASYTVCDSGCNYTTIAAALAGAGNGNNTVTVKTPYSANEAVTVSQSGTNASSVFTLTAIAGATINIKNVYVTGNYVTVHGFTLGGTTYTVDGAYIEVAGTYVTISNNTLNMGGSETFGIMTYNGSTLVDHSTLIGNTLILPANGNLGNKFFEMHGTNSSILNNNASGGGPDFCYMFGNHNLVQGNVWTSSATASTTNHPDFIQTFGDGEGSAYITVNANFAHDVYGQPCNLSSDGYTTGMGPYTFTNNVFINMAGACNAGIPNLSFYNNTFYNVDYANANAEIGFLYGSGFTGSGGIVENNIFIADFSQAGYAWASGYTGAGDYNYYATTSWGTRSGAPSETHGINGGNPHLVNAGGTTAGSYNLTSASTNLIGKAINQDSIFTNDYAGNTRPSSGAWDIGAFEFTATANQPLPNPPVLTGVTH